MHSPALSCSFFLCAILVRSATPILSVCAPCLRGLPAGFLPGSISAGHLAGKSCVVILLRALFLSLRFFQRSHRLFSIACSLFLQNTRGGGALCVSALWFAFVFIRHLSSYCYELLFSQALCFDNHLRCPGGVRVSTCGNHAWRLRLSVLPDNSCGIKHGGECT